MLEEPPHTPQPSDTWETIKLEGRLSPEQREQLYTVEIVNRLIEVTEDTLGEADFDDQEIKAFKDSLLQFDAESLKRIFSIPEENRLRLFKKYRKDVTEGKISMESIAEDINQNAKRYGFTLGYHLSNKEVRPSKNPDGTLSWKITPHELDDRDNQLMAYYSLSINARYTKKPTPYLYVVRAETGAETAHKRDGKNNWGRAPILSVIARLDMIEIDAKISKYEQELLKK